MTKLERMIAELCPDGVEYKTLGEVGEFYGGLSGKSKDDFTDGNARYITYMNVFSNLAVKTDIKDFVKVAPNERQNSVNVGDILFTGSSETREESGMSSVLTVEVDEPLYLNSFCFGLRLNCSNILLPGFSKYLFRSDELRKQIIMTASGVTRFNVSKEKMKHVRIPLPPLPIQQEIVRILDNFIELTAELTAELTKRNKQYEYYRNELLNFNAPPFWTNVRHVMLSEVCLRTNNIRWKETDEDYYYIDLTSVSRETNEIKPELMINAENAPSRAQQIIKTNDVLFATTRPTLKRYCYVPLEYNGHICSTGYCVLRANEQMIIPKFMFYSISTGNFYKYVEDNQEGTSYPAISDTKVKKYSFCLPSLAEQARIVSILDRFDLLTNDITSGLPAEIAARQKQYEYYRDKLLNFEEII